MEWTFWNFCGHKLCDTCRHEESHRNFDENYQRKHNFKINTTKTEQKIITEEELVVADDIITRNFVEWIFLAQGCKSFKSAMAQDNKSTILLEKNANFQAAKGQYTSTLDIIILKI